MRRFDSPLSWRAIFLLFGAAFLLRAVFAIEAGNGLVLSVPVGDEQVFLDWGTQVAGGQVAGQGTLWQAPGAAWLLGAWYSLVGPGLLAGRLLQALLGAGTAVLLADLGRRLGGRRVGLAAGWAWTLYAPAIFLGARLGKPAAATFFLVAAFQLVLVRRPWTAILAGLAIGAAALTRESLVLLVPLVLWELARSRGRLAAGLGLVGVLLAGGALMARNLAAGSPVLTYTVNLGPNLWIGNHEGADGLYQAMRPGRGSPGFEKEDARRLAEGATGRALDEGEVSAHWRREALDWVAREPGKALALLVTKARLLLHDNEWMDSVSYQAAREESRLLGVLGWPMRCGVLLPLALLGAIYTRSRWYLFAPALLVLAAHLPFFVFARFRAPAVPFLILLAVLGVRGLASDQGWRRQWRGLLFTLLWSVLAFLPVAPPHDLEEGHLEQSESALATSFNNVGVALGDLGRTAEARAAFERALGSDPEHANANFHMGRLLAEADELDRAEPYLAAAVGAAPHYEVDARLVVVASLIGQGRLEVAQRELEAVAQLGAADGEVAYRCGRLFRQLGDGDRAASFYQRAIELDPGLAAAANDLGFLRLTYGDLEGALEGFEKALVADPGLRPALVNLASFLASVPREDLRDGTRALELARRAASAGTSPSVALDLEAMALAELGRFEEADQVSTRSVEHARDEGQAAYAADVERRRALYRARRPYRSG